MEKLLKSEKALNKLNNIRGFLLSERWLVILFLLAGLITSLSSFFPEARLEIPGTIFFAYIVGITFVLSDDIMAGLIPFMFTYMIAIRCYDSFDEFMAYKWFALPLIPMLIFHLIAYWKPLTTKGTQFMPMIFVSASILLGGIGFISPEEYFAPTSIYHMLGLGFGMVVVYSYFYAHLGVDKNYSIFDMLTKIMVVTGCFASFMVISHYIINVKQVIDEGGIIFLQWRNNCSTILMITMPFAFLLANKKSYATIFGFVFYFAMLLTGSRGGMVFGAVELALCVLAFILFDRNRRKAYVIICACLGVGALAISPFIMDFLSATINRLVKAVTEFLAGEGTEIRARHYARGVEDFLNQPILGTGLGYMGNRDVHASKEFALCWYHCEPLQIAASFGIVGIVAFTYQFIRRNMLMWKKPTLFSLTIFLSYISLEMMSLVNPGILCPLPYLMLVTLFFVVLEKCDKGEYEERLTIRKK